MWYAMAARPPLFPEALPWLRQSLVLFGDLLKSHFHVVKTDFEPTDDFFIAVEQEK